VAPCGSTELLLSLDHLALARAREQRRGQTPGASGADGGRPLRRHERRPVAVRRRSEMREGERAAGGYGEEEVQQGGAEEAL